MPDANSTGGDVLGIKIFGESLKMVTERTANFLGKICSPAADEFGLLCKDRISLWRMKNSISIAKKAEKILQDNGGTDGLHGHPRLIIKALEDGSWTDTPELQDLWAGLLASSCTENGKDESNLLFMHLLNQMTSSQARLIDYACKNAKITVTKELLVNPDLIFEIQLAEVEKIMGINDIHRIDRELDHLRESGLIGGIFSGGISFDKKNDGSQQLRIDIAPKPLLINMYVRCQGTTASPAEYFGIEYVEQDEKNS